MNSLLSPRVTTVLERLYEEAERNDPQILSALRDASASRGEALNDQKGAALLDDAYLAVAPEVGRFLYALVRLKQPDCMVEFGASHGISAIHIAAALKDNGRGRLITTEQSTAKVGRALANLKEAGLSALVDIREGDAFETLAEDPPNIDVLLLDGWKELYLPLLRQLEPRLTSDALVIADDLKLMPEILKPYADYVRAPSSGYISCDVPMDDGLELSLRVA